MDSRDTDELIKVFKRSVNTGNCLPAERTELTGLQLRCTECGTSDTEIAHGVLIVPLSIADAKRLEWLAEDNQLQAVVDARQSLPESLRAGIVAMVASCQPKA